MLTESAGLIMILPDTHSSRRQDETSVLSSSHSRARVYRCDGFLGFPRRDRGAPGDHIRPSHQRERTRASGFGNVRNDPDLISSKLAALHLYQLAIPAPTAPEGSFDRRAAARGKVLFKTKAQCATCHVPPLFTEPGLEHAPRGGNRDR